MARLQFVTLLAAGLLWVHGSAQAVTAADFLRRNEPAPAGQLPYRIYVPAVCQTQRCPIVVFLHGSGESGTDNNKQLNNNGNGVFAWLSDVNQATQPMIMVAPQVVGNWTSAPIINILDDVYEEFPYDRERIYLTGLSLGGGGTTGIAMSYSKVFAAAVPIARNDNYNQDAKRLVTLPMWLFHAANDGGCCPSTNSSNLVAAIRAAGGDPVYTEYATGGHGIWVQSYAKKPLFSWLIAQRRGRPPQLPEPFLRIDTPTTVPLWQTNASSLNLAGTAGPASAAISAIRWFSGGSSGAASGTSNWQAAAVPLANGSNILRMQGTGTSYDTALLGRTEFSDTLRVQVPAAANKAPSLKVVSEPYARAGEKIEFVALAGNDDGPSPLQVTWSVYGSPAGVVLQVHPDDPWRATVVSAPVGSYRIRAQVSDGSTTVTHDQRLMVIPATGPVPTVIAINAGGPEYVAKDGTRYLADQYFVGGDLTSDQAKEPIYGTRDDALYWDYRLTYWSFQYEIPVPNGKYYVVLHFAETYNPVDAVNDRVMQVTMNNPVLPNEVQRLDNFSPYQLVGQRYALRYGIFAEVTDGKIHLDFKRLNNLERARIDAIQVLRRM